MTVAIFIFSLLGAMAIGLPIAFSLLVCGVALMLYLGMFDAQILASNLLAGADSFPLMAVPFFLLAGEFMNAGGLSRRIVNAAMTWIGHHRGGLGYVAVMASIIMASLSGSAVADTAAVAALLIPMMRDQGYNIGRSAGLIASGGIIAPVIPPALGVWLAWRRPTLPCLEAQYHGRCGVSRPSSEWDRVGHPCCDHQANETPSRQSLLGWRFVLTGMAWAAGRGQMAEARSDASLISDLWSLDCSSR